MKAQTFELKHWLRKLESSQDMNENHPWTLLPFSTSWASCFYLIIGWLMVTGQRHHWPDVFAPWRQWDRFRGDTTSNHARWVYVSADLILIDVWLGLLQYAPEQKRLSNVCIPLGRCSDTHDSLHIEKDRWYTVPLLRETYFNGTELRLVKETSWSWSHPSQFPREKKYIYVNC